MVADETQPLLPNSNGSSIIQDEDAVKDIVYFDPNGDEENPLDWPISYKWSLVTLLALMSFTVTFTCISVVPVANHIVSDLSNGAPSKSASVLLVTIWELGEAAGPLLIAPLSEAVGRAPVLHAANTLFISAVILAALCHSVVPFIACRALTGLAVASNVLNPAIVGDLFVPEARGSPMSLVSLAPLVGGAVGPAISGAVAERFGWRAVLWMAAALAVGCEVLFVAFLRETYRVPILRRKAARLRAETGNEVLRTEFDVGGKDGETGLVWEHVVRPFLVFFDSGPLQALSLFNAVVFTYFYVMSTTLPEILLDRYGLSPTATGLSFITFSLGSIVSVMICNSLLDRIYARLRAVSHGVGQPEFRLPLVIFGGFALPLTVALYGWVAQATLPLPFMLISVAIMGGALMMAFIPIITYVVDAFGLHSASAMTSLLVTRCLMSTFMPLATGPLVRKLNWGLAFTVLGAVLLALTPIPIAIMRYGHRWRMRSKYTRDE